MVLAAARRGLSVIGIDIAFRWLVVARRRLQRAGSFRTARLLQRRASALRVGETFDRVVSLGTLEHCLDAERALEESARVSAPAAVRCTFAR